MLGFRKMSLTMALLLAAVLSVSVEALANTEEAPSLEITRSVFLPYAESHDVKYVTDNVIFFNAALQESFAIGREALGEALYWFYHVAFDAIAIPKNIVIGQGKAVYEGTIVGTHIGEFAGIPATGNHVAFPIIISYELERTPPYHIRRATIYMILNMQEALCTATYRELLESWSPRSESNR